MTDIHQTFKDICETLNELMTAKCGEFELQYHLQYNEKMPYYAGIELNEWVGSFIYLCGDQINKNGHLKQPECLEGYFYKKSKNYRWVHIFKNGFEFSNELVRPSGSYVASFDLNKIKFKEEFTKGISSMTLHEIFDDFIDNLVQLNRPLHPLNEMGYNTNKMINIIQNIAKKTIDCELTKLNSFLEDFNRFSKDLKTLLSKLKVHDQDFQSFIREFPNEVSIILNTQTLKFYTTTYTDNLKPDEMVIKDLDHMKSIILSNLETRSHLQSSKFLVLCRDRIVFTDNLQDLKNENKCLSHIKLHKYDNVRNSNTSVNTSEADNEFINEVIEELLIIRDTYLKERIDNIVEDLNNGLAPNGRFILENVNIECIINSVIYMLINEFDKQTRNVLLHSPSVEDFAKKCKELCDILTEKERGIKSLSNKKVNHIYTFDSKTLNITTVPYSYFGNITEKLHYDAISNLITKLIKDYRDDFKFITLFENRMELRNAIPDNTICYLDTNL